MGAILLFPIQFAGAAGPETTLLEPSFETIEGRLSEGFLLLCDHASNRLPAEYGDLGLGPEQLRRHIAFDIGTADLTRILAARLGAPAILSRFSRLLVDLNRGEDDPTLVMRLSDGAVVPGNAQITPEERARRIAAYHRPYHDAINAVLDAGLAAGIRPAILSLHSFTPVWRGVKRPWQAGVLSALDRRLAERLLAGLSADPELVVGDNEPYSGALKNDTLHRHGANRGLTSAILEVRQDLIADAAGIADWVDRLVPILQIHAHDPEIHTHYDSQS